MEFINDTLLDLGFELSAVRNNEKVVAKVAKKTISEDKEEINIHYIFYKDNIIVDQQAISYLNKDEDQMEKDLLKLLYRNNIM
jgi:hypothetical protein